MWVPTWFKRISLEHNYFPAGEGSTSLWMMTVPVGSDRSWKDRRSPGLKAVAVQVGPHICKQSPSPLHLGSRSAQLIFNTWLVIWLIALSLLHGVLLL